MRLHSSSAFLEQSEIMCSYIEKIRRKNFSCLNVCDYLNFLAFFLSAVTESALFLTIDRMFRSVNQHCF